MGAVSIDAPGRPARTVRSGPTPEWRRTVSDTAKTRLGLGLVALASLAAGSVGLAVDDATLRWAGLLVFCVIGIGSAPWQLAAGLGLDIRLVLTGTTALCAWTLPATAMALTGWWRPMTVFAVLAAVATGLHLVGLRRAWFDDRAGADTPDRAGADASRWPVALAVVGALACLGAALVSRPIDPGFWGFLTTIAPAWYAGLALILVGFVFSLRQRERRIAIIVLLLVVVLTLTPSIVYEGPRSQSAFKHIDLVAQIRGGGVLHSAVPAYDSWPGFFAAVAWLCDVTGIHDVVELATFWPPLLGLFRLVALRGLAGRLLESTAQRWVAVVLAVLLDSIGADYFSPQSVGFVLALAVFTLALSPGLGGIRVVMLLAAGCTVAVSHQLSPFIISGVLVVLAVTRLVRPWWVPLLVVVPTVAWTALQIDSVVEFLNLRSLGQLTNFRPPPVATAPGLSRLPVVTESVVAMVAALLFVGILALVSVLRSWRDRRIWGQALAPAVGMALIVVNPYGQEGIFRAVLFAVPWVAILAARCFSGAPRLRSRLPLMATVAALTGLFMAASFGLDAINVVRPADVHAVTYAQHQGGNRYQLLYLGAGDIPDTLRRGPVLLNRDVLKVPVEELRGQPVEQQLQRLTYAYANYWGPPDGGPSLMYALWSPVSARYADAYGLQRPEQFEQLRDALLASPYWRVAYRSGGTVLFQLEIAKYEAAQAAGGR